MPKPAAMSVETIETGKGAYLIGFSGPHQLGELVNPMGVPGVIVAEISREKFLEGMEILKRARLAGIQGKAGIVDFGTKQYMPTTEVPAEMTHFYICLPPEAHLSRVLRTILLLTNPPAETKQ